MKRLAKVLKWSGIVFLGLIAVLLLTNAIWAWRASARLEREIALIREAGDPVTLEEWMPDPIPDEENAAYWMKQASNEAEKIEDVLNPIFSAEKNYDWYRDPTPDQKVILEKAYALSPAFFDYVDRAVECEKYVPLMKDPSDYLMVDAENDSLKLSNNVRRVVRLLEYRGSWALSEGKVNESMRDALRILCVAKKHHNEPTLIHSLVAIAFRGMSLDLARRAIATGEVDLELARRFDAELATDDFQAAWVHAVKTERCFMIQSFDQYPSRRVWLIVRPWWDGVSADYLDIMRRRIAVSASEDGDFLAASRRELAERDHSWTTRLIIGPAFDVAYKAFARSMAMNRVARIAIAIRLHADETALPDRPTARDLGLDAEVFVDPMREDGGPLHVARNGGDWLIYSVGFNGKDDGGLLLCEYKGQDRDNTDDGWRIPVLAAAREEAPVVE